MVEYNYNGDDLGCTYEKSCTKFRVWAPTAESMNLKLYKEGLGDNFIQEEPMTKDVDGTWVGVINGDMEGVYYTYQVTIGEVTTESVDPYAKAVGANGQRAMVIDLNTTNPEGWEEDKAPEFGQITDAIIYELHIRDLSSDKESGIVNTGKYLGVIETGTTNSKGVSTGLDHIKELGITHLHLLPVYDYATVDETKLDQQQFNWGYDPLNYNVPEGSYSTDPFHGEVRIREFKKMVQGLHKNGIRVVMDVVYNHTYSIEGSSFHKLVPEYYYRKENGKYTNGSGCGNETASERFMVRKYILDSVMYWAKEYHIDGFRFDLMGVHDIETMNIIRDELKKIDPTIIVYGEGWCGGYSALEDKKSALKKNAAKMGEIAFFNDDLRDGLKGSIVDFEQPGFINGGSKMEENIRFGIVGATSHKGVNKKPWALNPSQSINYVSAHDDLTLWDKLEICNAKDSVENRRKMNKLAAAIVLSSQGVPFFQAGEELLRSKPSSKEPGKFISNSYCSLDEVNSLKWEMKNVNIDIVRYYQGLIAFRKQHPALRMTTKEQVNQHLHFMRWQKKNTVSYIIDGEMEGETAKKICVIHNANNNSVKVRIPKGNWKVYVNGESSGVEPLAEFYGDIIQVEAISSCILTME